MLMQAIDSYLQLRRAGGYQLRDTEVLLKEFACFAAERGEIHIKADTAIAWASRATSQQQRARRLNNLILFARYIRAEDAEHQLPPAGVFAHHVRSRRLPHIFAPTQIAAILAEAKQLPPAGSLRPLTFYTLFGLVAACGLRISEALALQIDDIRPDGLYIRETKFRKSRVVALHPTAEKQLILYLDRRQRLAPAETRVFISLRVPVVDDDQGRGSVVFPSLDEVAQADFFEIWSHGCKVRQGGCHRFGVRAPPRSANRRPPPAQRACRK